MKKFKFSSMILPILAIFLLLSCDTLEYYAGENNIDQLEELDRTDLVALNNWLYDNEEDMGDLFNFVHIRVDLVGNELDYMSQVIGLDFYYFDSWSFHIGDDTITFTYRWDYERAMATPVEEEDPVEIGDILAADNERLANWISEDVIPQFEDINVEDPDMFIETTGEFIAGIESTLYDLNASNYVTSQIEHIVAFIEDVQNVVLENSDEEELDLEEVRDIILDSLIEMKNLFIESLDS